MQKYFAPILALVIALPTDEAWAGLRYVSGEGRAVITGNDVTQARKSALADALYEAAAQLGTKIKGASQLNNGVFKDEHSILVDGHIRQHQIVAEGRENGSYFVKIDGIGDSDDTECSASRVDLDMRKVRIQVAKGITGYNYNAVVAGLRHGIDYLGEGDSFRVADQSHLPAISGAERNNNSTYDYMAQFTNSVPSLSGYSLSGDILVERIRNDGLLTSATDIQATLSLKLYDNFTGSQIGLIRKSLTQADRRTIYGIAEAWQQQPHIDLHPLFEQARAELEQKLACQPLRAAVMEAGPSGIMLSVGAENGVNEGDYFLLTFTAAKNQWQIVQVETVNPRQAMARTLKPTPKIVAGTTALLMR